MGRKLSERILNFLSISVLLQMLLGVISYE